MFGPFTITETDPVDCESFNRQHDQAVCNSLWLSSHWPDLLPAALGKFVAVAGQEAFIADTSEEARARAEAAHPDDKGLIVQYVPPEKGPAMFGPFTITETDPVDCESFNRQHDQAVCNSLWLSSHWPDLLPAALGKFVAVAGQEAFIADTSEEACARAEAAHPDDKGLLIKYVSPAKGPRIYAVGRLLAPLPGRCDEANDQCGDSECGWDAAK